MQFVARGTFRGTRARHKHVSQIKGLLFGNSATCHPSSSSQGPGKQGFHALPQRSSGATCKLVGLISPKSNTWLVRSHPSSRFGVRSPLVGLISPTHKVETQMRNLVGSISPNIKRWVMVCSGSTACVRCETGSQGRISCGGFGKKRHRRFAVRFIVLGLEMAVRGLRGVFHRARVGR